MKKSKHGGARSGSGPKPKEDKKKPYTFYFLNSEVELFDSKEAFKQIAYKQMLKIITNKKKVR